MAGPIEIVVTLPGGRRVDAQVRGHRVRTDQPLDGGGEDTAPSHFELFLASIGTCAGIFVQGFSAKRGLPFEGIRIAQRLHLGEDSVLRGSNPTIPTRGISQLTRLPAECHPWGFRSNRRPHGWHFALYHREPDLTEIH